MRYVIGIDLGTTNSSVAYVDTENPQLIIQPFRISQLTALGKVDALATLPSFCYLAAAHEWPAGALDLPWRPQTEYFVGRFSQEQGAKVPTRVIQSAKSWLCHAAANRRDKILPFEAADQAQRISPIEATARYLRHIKEAWNYAMAQGDPASEFEAQEIILTVPASFDEVARTLTVEAARLAGFVKMTLLEEPQAAFYSWIAQHETVWEQQLRAGDSILVCDVGGGTTDFSLLEVTFQEGKLAIQRMAVGDHLLLGGDNMDAALTHYLEEKLRKTSGQALPELTTTQWLQLRYQAHCAKEALLSPEAVADRYKVILHGTGSGVVSGTLSVEVTHEEVQKLLVNGFFGQFSWQDAVHLHKARGLRTMGLPYEDDPSITKHMAHFLKQCSPDEHTLKAPHYILFNGGVMKAPAFQKAILESLSHWFPERNPQVLPSYHLDLAVGRGAAYYGKVRRGLGVRIGGGAAQGYYMAIEVKDAAGSATSQALTLLPRGSEEGSTYEPEQLFWLKPNTPVSFQLYASHVRLHDKQGDLIPIDPSEIQALPPIHTVLRFGKQKLNLENQETIPVHLSMSLTAIGTVEIWLKSQKTEHKWALEFQVRSASGQENSLAVLEETRKDEIFDASYVQAAKQGLQDLYAGTSKVRPEQIMEQLETWLECPRREWSLSVLRGLADAVLLAAPRRACSLAHEIRWWNLIGFLLRPGFGYALDDFRLKELWKIILVDSKILKSTDLQIQRWICYRRIAGGLNKGQQGQLASDLLSTLINKKSGKLEVKGKADLYQYFEKLRVLGAFELLDTAMKIKLGQALVERIAAGDAHAAEYWTLGRLGARHLIYGSGANVIPSAVVSQWIPVLLRQINVRTDDLIFVLGQLARKIDQRELNLPQETVTHILTQFADHPQYGRLQALLSGESPLSEFEQEQVLGDRLPVGLILQLL